MPDFWTGLMLITLFAVLIPIFPTAGFTTWSSLVLPTVTIAILQIALISRLVRREMSGAFTSPYITVARSRGVSERELIWRYAMRNSAIPVFTPPGTRQQGEDLGWQHLRARGHPAGGVGAGASAAVSRRHRSRQAAAAPVDR